MSVLWQEVLYKPLFNALIFLYNTVAFGDMGIAIIELTIIIRLLLLSPSLKALRAQFALQKLQPELEKIKKKYKDDKQKQTQAALEFYQKHKVNPLSSCLPTLIQFPILIALFWILKDGLKVENLQLLYPFVSRPEYLNNSLLGLVDLAANKNLILALLAGIAQFFQSKMMMPKTTPGGGKGMQSIISSQLTYFMPVLTVIFAYQFPAGLALYWAATTLFAIATQYFVLKEEKSGKLEVAKNKGE